MNVPPGFMKSLTTNVFWPAYEWGPMQKPWLRYIAASYSQALTIRDNVRFRNIISSPQYLEDFGTVFGPSKDQFSLLKVGNDKTGWKLATSVGGVGTGERGNRFIIDDGNSVAEAESEAVTDSTNQWFTEVVPTRLNSLDDDVIINIQQRTGELDISGVILSKEMGYVHLMIPMEYDDTRHCRTVLGWSDPRTVDGELAWEARFSRKAVTQLKRDMGPYAVAGQLQQRPTPRGGGILKRSYWQLWDEPKFPSTISLVVASLDPAYTEKQENDPSGFTVWGLFKDKGSNTKIILMDAWLKRLELHGLDDLLRREPNEPYAAWRRRTEEHWGLVEWVAHTCMRFNVNRLLIEAKASGLSVAQEIRRLYGNSAWGVETKDPKNQDKVARAYAIQPMLADGMVYAPDRAWAELVIEECEAFKAGAPRDNLVDSTTQALKWFRDSGLAIRREERAAQEQAAMMHRSEERALYPV
jgi:predicted phage terminase large subunit-like protein